MTFFVAGLARSRTAWLAAYMNADGVTCYHEGLELFDTSGAYYKALSSGHTGDCTTALSITKADERFPSAPLVIIERPTKEVHKSLRIMGLTLPLAQLEAMQEQHLSRDGLRVPFHEIDNMLPAICEHVGVRYCKVRHDIFKTLRIQQVNVSTAKETARILKIYEGI